MAQPRARPANNTANETSGRGPPGPRGTPAKNRGTSEPDLVVFLADPEVRLLMHADHIDEREMMAMFDAVRVHLRSYSESKDENGQNDESLDQYRPSVGIMLLNARGDVFIGRRADVPHEAWQMPQGGIDAGETPSQAALRELKEEIGTAKAEIIAESRRWLYYDVPEELARAAWRGRWKGQRQKWFAMLFKGADSDINIAGGHPDAWRWVPVQELTELAVSSKRQLYLNVVGEFATIFRD